MAHGLPLAARVFIGTSLDGFIARPDGDLEWLTSRGAAAEGDLGYGEFMAGIDTVVMGRVSYETVIGFGEENWPYQGKHVAVLSTRLPADADARITVHRSMEELLEALVERGSKVVYADGGQVVREFLRAGLVEEMTISTVPVLIGAGLPLFGEREGDLALRLRSVRDAGGGIVQTVYAVDR
ncbi:dihydrofolate reductase family protein [Spirillospora sp. CA-253888]